MYLLRVFYIKYEALIWFESSFLSFLKSLWNDFISFFQSLFIFITTSINLSILPSLSIIFIHLHPSPSISRPNFTCLTTSTHISAACNQHPHITHLTSHKIHLTSFKSLDLFLNLLIGYILIINHQQSSSPLPTNPHPHFSFPINLFHQSSFFLYPPEFYFQNTRSRVSYLCPYYLYNNTFNLIW